LFVDVAQDGEVEAQVAVGDAVERGIARVAEVGSSTARTCFSSTRRRGSGEGARGERAVAAAGGGSDVGVGAVSAADGFQDPAGLVGRGELGQERDLGDGEDEGGGIGAFLSRKASAGVAWGQARRIPGRPPLTRCASIASAAARPRAWPVSAGLRGPRMWLSARP
jgi:hypothetical protein